METPCKPWRCEMTTAPPATSATLTGRPFLGARLRSYALRTWAIAGRRAILGTRRRRGCRCRARFGARGLGTTFLARLLGSALATATTTVATPVAATIAPASGVTRRPVGAFRLILTPRPVVPAAITASPAAIAAPRGATITAAISTALTVAATRCLATRTVWCGASGALVALPVGIGASRARGLGRGARAEEP